MDSDKAEVIKTDLQIVLTAHSQVGPDGVNCLHIDLADSRCQPNSKCHMVLPWIPGILKFDSIKSLFKCAENTCLHLLTAFPCIFYLSGFGAIKQETYFCGKQVRDDQQSMDAGGKRVELMNKLIKLSNFQGHEYMS